MTAADRAVPGPAPASCSELARSTREPLAGTAPQAALWLAVEQPGSWGARAVLDSGLPRAVGDGLMSLRERFLPFRVRPLLIRRPAHRRSSRRGEPAQRTVLVARTVGEPALWRLSLSSPREVLDLDIAAVLAGDDLGVGERLQAPVVLVCTNGGRDACCALRGRPAATQLVAAGHDVWESSHIGGHRFSPTVLQLPDGWAFGGEGATTLLTASCRGRTALTPEEQAAELAVLSELDHLTPARLDVAPAGPGRFSVGGRTVVVRRDESLPPRPESCGGPAVLPRPPVAQLL